LLLSVLVWALAQPATGSAQSSIKTKAGETIGILPTPPLEYKVKNEPCLGYVLRTGERAKEVTITWHDFSNKKSPGKYLPPCAVLMPTKMETIKVRNIKMGKKGVENEYSTKFLEINPYTNDFMFDCPGAKLEFIGIKDVPFMGWYYKPGGRIEINEDGEAVPTKETVRHRE